MLPKGAALWRFMQVSLLTCPLPGFGEHPFCDRLPAIWQSHKACSSSNFELQTLSLLAISSSVCLLCANQRAYTEQAAAPPPPLSLPHKILVEDITIPAVSAVERQVFNRSQKSLRASLSDSRHQCQHMLP